MTGDSDRLQLLGDAPGAVRGGAPLPGGFRRRTAGAELPQRTGVAGPHLECRAHRAAPLPRRAGSAAHHRVRRARARLDARWHEEEPAMRSLVGGLTSAELARPIGHRNRTGPPVLHPALAGVPPRGQSRRPVPGRGGGGALGHGTAPPETWTSSSMCPNDHKTPLTKDPLRFIKRTDGDLHPGSPAGWAASGALPRRRDK